MTAEHKRRLLASAKKIKNRPKTRQQTIDTFSAAGILTKSGNFTKHYAGTLGKVMTIAAAK